MLEQAKLDFPKGSIAKYGESNTLVMILGWKMAPGDKEPWANVVVGLMETSIPFSKLKK